MKKFILECAIVVFAACIAPGQSITLPWTVLDGGGGMSSGGSYTLIASVGQNSADTMRATGFLFEGGYIPGLRMLAGTLTTTQLSIQISWNLLSVPLRAPDMRKATLYPAASSPAFFYEPGGYQTKDTLAVGTGYWLKFADSESYPLTGSAVVLDTIPVLAGWNMIGAMSYPTPITSIVPLGGMAVRSPYFGYANGVGYVGEDTLKPGIGYWVKVDSTGLLVLKAPTIVPSAAPGSTRGSPKQTAQTVSKRKSNAFTGFSTLTVRDNSGRERKLLYRSAPADVDLSQAELPPTPPADAFDVRFSSGRYAEIADGKTAGPQEFPIRLTGGVYPLTVSWNCGSGGVGEAILVKSADGKTKAIPLAGKGSLLLDEANVASARLRLVATPEVELPKVFALYQNYPNPFNPTTKIRYDLPQASHVTLKMFNLLGQEVRTLMNEERAAGAYTYVLDAFDLPSGLYFYRMQAGSVGGTAGEKFSATMKLMLVK